MLAATRTPLTASGSAPGRTVLIARMVARSGEKSAALRRSETSASVTSKDTPSSLSAVPRCHHSRKRMIQYSHAFIVSHAVSDYSMPAYAGMTAEEANGSLFRRHLVRGRHAARLHHHLDRIFDAVLGVADRGRQVVEGEGVSVDLGGVEALLAHEGFGAVGRALAFAADAVDVVAHDLGDIDRRLLVREGRKADFAAAVDHAHRLVDGVGRARALEHVVDALAAVELAHRRDRVLAPDVDDVVGTELAADLEAVVARAGEDDRLRAERLRDGNAEEPDRAGAGDHDALARDQPAELGEPVHGGAGGDHQRRFLVRHRVGNGNQRVDVVDLIFAEAAVGGETVGAVTFIDVAVVEPIVVTGGVHALAAALALAAAGMNLDGHALADAVFVDARPERDHSAHVFVPGGEVLVVRHAAPDQRRRPVIDDLEVGRADRDRVDAHQHLGLLRHRDRLLPQRKLAGIAEHPRLHGVRDGIVRAHFYSGWRVHMVPLDTRGRASMAARARNDGRNRSGSRLVYVSLIFEGYYDRSPTLIRRE